MRKCLERHYSWLTRPSRIWIGIPIRLIPSPPNITTSMIPPSLPTPTPCSPGLTSIWMPEARCFPSHTQIVKSNLSITEIFGFIREKAFSTLDQPFSPQQFATFAASLPEVASAMQGGGITSDDLLIHNLISTSNIFPGISIVDAGPIFPSYPYSTLIRACAAGQAAFTGVFQIGSILRRTRFGRWAGTPSHLAAALATPK